MRSTKDEILDCISNHSHDESNNTSTPAHEFDLAMPSSIQSDVSEAPCREQNFQRSSSAEFSHDAQTDINAAPPPTLCKSKSLSDLEPRHRVSYSHQVGRRIDRGSKRERGNAVTMCTNEQTEDRVETIAVGTLPAAPATPQPSPEELASRQNRKEATPQMDLLTHQQTGRRTPPPPPLERSLVQHRYTSPGAISIRPRQASSEAQAPPPPPLSDYSSCVSPNLDAEASPRMPYFSSPDARFSRYGYEILIEAHLVEEVSTATREVPPASPRRPVSEPALSSPLPDTPTTFDSAPDSLHGTKMRVTQTSEVYIDELDDFTKYSCGCCHRRRCYLMSNRNVLVLLTIAALLGAIGLTLGLRFRVSHHSQTSPATAAKNSSLEYFVQTALPPYSQQAILEDSGSPQAKAIQFLKHDPQFGIYNTMRRLTRFALAVFYYDLHRNLGDYSWGTSAHWLTNSSECDWYTTHNSSSTSDGRFVTLALEGNQLAGTLPAEISLLADLESIDLSGNFIRGNIPNEIDELRSLSLLDLGFNDMDGTIPRSLKNLTKLGYLDLFSNYLTGSIQESLFAPLAELAPERPGSAAQPGSTRGSNRRTTQSEDRAYRPLEYADFGDNMLTGTFPSSIGLALRLGRLSLRENYLKGTVPASLSNLTLLTYFGTYAWDSRCFVSTMILTVIFGFRRSLQLVFR
jgi:hypothetical protein